MFDLGPLFTPLTHLINKRIAEQTPARELAESLEGQCMAVRVRDTGLAVYLQVEDGKLRLRTRYDEEPEVVLSGSPISLAELAGKDPAAPIREGRVRMSGDAAAGLKFQGLLRFAAPDLEDELANVVGDVAAHQATRVARGIAGAAGKLGDRVYANVGDYLTEGAQTLPSRDQFDRFRANVETLRDDVARAEARVRLLRDYLAAEDDEA